MCPLEKKHRSIFHGTSTTCGLGNISWQALRDAFRELFSGWSHVLFFSLFFFSFFPGQARQPIRSELVFPKVDGTLLVARRQICLHRPINPTGTELARATSVLPVT